jgi:hypothetical protein
MYHPTKKPMFFSPQKATENMIYLPGISSNIAIENRGTCWNMNTLCHFLGDHHIKNPSADCADFPMISTMSL